MKSRSLASSASGLHPIAHPFAIDEKTLNARICGEKALVRIFALL
jgi:hypothetical protein